MKYVLTYFQKVTLLMMLLLVSGAALSVWAINAQAQMPSTTTLSGWIWAGTQQADDGSKQGIGWISVNSATDGSSVDYAVEVATDLSVSGYAWSENVGWIQFMHKPGESPTKIEKNGDNWQLTGWARALAPVGDSQAGGWDGWISLDGANYSILFNQNGQTVGSPFAWGADVMGWLNFTNIQVDKFSCSNVSSCDGNDLVTSDLFCSDEFSRIACEFGCESGACLDGIAGSLVASPAVFRYEGRVRLEWEAPTATACEITSTESGHSVQGSLANVGSIDSEPMTNNEVTFTLTCDGFEVDTATVRRLPRIYES